MDALGSNCYAWIDVSFLDEGSNLLALYTSADFSTSVGTNVWFQFDVTNACDLSSPVSTGDPYFTNYTVSGAVTQLVAPTGTAQVRYRFAYLQSGTEGGSCYFDDPALVAAVSGITISASLLGANVVISFPTQPEIVYRILSRGDLTTGNWGLLTTVPGNGAIESVSIPAATAAQFFQVVAP